MVKIREGLPLTDGKTTETDSASLTAQLAHGFHKVDFPIINTFITTSINTSNNASINSVTLSSSNIVNNSGVHNKNNHHKNNENITIQNKTVKNKKWHDDYKRQLHTRKLESTLDRSPINNREVGFVDNVIDEEDTQKTNLVISPLESIEKTTNSHGFNEESTKEPTEALNIDVNAWLSKVAKRIDKNKLEKLSKAVALTQELDSRYKGQRSNTFVTGIGMTDILTYLYQDEDALVSAMLYRSARHKLISNEDIAEKFGEDIATLVVDALAMGKLSETIEKNPRLEDHFVNNQREQLSNIYSMLISVTNDVRAVLIKLAERTFAMRELSFSSEERQKRVAREVMTIYAPLAHRLGVAQIKWELEDLSFRYFAPERYKEIAKLLSEKRSEREDYIERVEHLLRDALQAEGIEADISGRVKHIYSIYRKMKLKNLSFDQLYDIRALRVMVNNKSECYHALGIVHSLWRHIPEQFDDYITNPKANGYRSLHTAVIAEQKSLEVQIRTNAMHFEAELGMCAHVNYKEGGKSDKYLNRKISSLRHLLALNSDKNNSDKNSNEKNNSGDSHKNENFIEGSLENSTTHYNTSSQITNNEPEKSELKNSQARQTSSSSPLPNKIDELDEEEQLVDFEGFERIYIFSRDGDIIELPKGATVLDCAYYIHTQVGNRAQAGRVNQRYVPLTYQLKTGEQVEIITKSSREPNRDWLVSSLGYITTSRAKSKLRQWFNRLDRDKNIEIGRQMLSSELERLTVHPNSIDLNEFSKHFGVQGADDILVALVSGDIGIHQLTNQISRQLNLEPDDEFDYQPTIHPKATSKLGAYDIYVEGLDNIELNLAKCCSPVQGEPISGFITQSKGVSIHNRGCVEYARLIDRDPARAIEAVWYSKSGRKQPIAIYIEAYDRKGLLRDMTQIIDNEGINIRKVGTESSDDDIAHMNFHIEVSGLSQLSKLLAKLEQQHGVIIARRSVG